MTNNIIFDLDETLIHSRGISQSLSNTDQLLKGFKGHEFHKGYCTFIRGTALAMLAYAKNLVGKNNTYIATISQKEYAEDICGKAFGISKNNVFSREFLLYDQEDKLKGDNNFLIDDVEFRHNFIKTDKFGIPKSHYIKADPFEPFFGLGIQGDSEDKFLQKLFDQLNHYLQKS